MNNRHHLFWILTDSKPLSDLQPQLYPIAVLLHDHIPADHICSFRQIVTNLIKRVDGAAVAVNSIQNYVIVMILPIEVT